MKHFALLLILLAFGILWTACNTEQKAKLPEKSPSVTASNEPVPSPVPSPVRHDSLSPTQLEDIKTIHATFSAVYPVSLNESIKNFQRDQNPDREIQIWMKMVETFNTVTSEGKYSSIGQRQEVFSVILASTMMPLEKIKADVELSLLSESEIEQISTLFMSSFAQQ